MKAPGAFGSYPRLFPLVLSVSVAGCTVTPQWTQWGGPDRNFMVEAAGLADEWPADGPRKLWHRELGDGYSTIAVDGHVLYTMYRTDGDEFTVALDAETGETVWEHKNTSPTTPLMEQYGPGPHATPLIAGNRLFSIGSNAVMHCFDKRTGDVLWKHNLPEEFNAPVPGRGYGCSPIVYGSTVIVAVDRQRPDEEEGSSEESAAKDETDAKGDVEGQTLVAFDQATGNVIWKGQDHVASYPSPILIEFDGQEQLVFLTSGEMIGINPANGKLLWKHDLDPRASYMATPLWMSDGLVFVSAAYGAGSRVIKLTKQDGKTVPEELWSSKKLRIHHANAIRMGDYLYGSSGDMGTALLVCMNIHTGKVAWRKRGFAKATLILAGERVIVLDEEGQLALATFTPEGMTLRSQCKLTERYSWAAPTLVGKTLYLRDRQHIMALDLGKSQDG